MRTIFNFSPADLLLRFSRLNRHFSTNRLFIAVKRYNLLCLLAGYVYILPADLGSHRQDRCQFSFILIFLNLAKIMLHFSVFLRPRFRRECVALANLGDGDWHGCGKWSGSLGVETPLNREKKRMGTCGGLEVGGYGASCPNIFLEEI